MHKLPTDGIAYVNRPRRKYVELQPRTACMITITEIACKFELAKTGAPKFGRF